jgi:MarR family 2-MHQ and catechol resistance regulon transcriptional repressor
MGTRYRGPAAEVAALNAYIKLMRAAESVTARVHFEVGNNLTVSQFGALEILLHCGSLSQRELADKLLRNAGNVTLVLDNLERRHLIQRERNPADRRYVTVHLTAKGRLLIQELFPKVAANVAREFSLLSLEDQRTLARLCKKLGLGRAPTAFVIKPERRDVPVSFAAVS